MANAVLLYTGSVCSTPMVEYARLTREVFVPVYEHFDIYALKKAGENWKTAPRVLEEALGALYRRQTSPYLDTPPLKSYRRGAAMPTVEEKPHIFFKWRPLAKQSRETEAIRDIFSQNEVVPALMLRRSNAEQALKVHLSESHYQDRHMQFRTARMSDADFARYLAEQKDVRIELGESDVERVRAIAEDFCARTMTLLEWAEFYFPSARPMKGILCEDIFDPTIDIASYGRTMQRLLGAPVSLGENAHPAVRKSGLNLEHCANPELVLEDERVRGFEESYQEILDGLERISEPAAPGGGT